MAEIRATRWRRLSRAALLLPLLACRVPAPAPSDPVGGSGSGGSRSGGAGGRGTGGGSPSARGGSDGSNGDGSGGSNGDGSGGSSGSGGANDAAAPPDTWGDQPVSDGSSPSDIGVVDAPAAPDPGNAIAVVAVDVAHPGTAVPANFVGLSLEWSQVLTFLGDGKGSAHPVTTQLLKNFADDGHRADLRIGGNSTDRTWWNPSGQPRPTGATIDITPSFFSTFTAVHAATGAHFIIGLDLGLDDAALAGAEMMAEMAALPRDMVDAFEIGNEPNVYHGNGHRPASYAFADYQSDIDRFLQTLSPLAMNGPRFALPAIEGGAWLPNLPGFIAAEKSHLAVVTVHRYPYFVCNATEVPPAPGDLLKDQATIGFTQPYQQVIQDAHQAGAAFRMAETNSVACGGVAGVSDAFAAAIWAADVMFRLATLQASGMNFHVAGKYSPFLYRNGALAVQGLYYGLLFFSRATAAEGKLLPVAITSQARVRAWAPLGSDGAVRVALLNEDLVASGPVTVTLGASHGTAQLHRLSAPGLAAVTAIRFGGLGFDGSTDGKPSTPAASDPVPEAKGSYTFTLSAASGAVLVAPAP